MTDESKLNKAISRQAQAEALMRNEVLLGIFAYLENLYLDSWKTCVDPVLREELWRSQANLANVRTQIGKVIADGKLAQREIDRLVQK